MNKTLELPVLDMQGKAIATLAISDYLFGIQMNMSVVHQAMVRQRANMRQGNSNVKTRANVSGGGAKPWRQKGTGRARQGSIRSPQWRGGGIVFGPNPRSYRQRMPKKMRRLAIRCLLSDKVREDRLSIIQDLQLPESKTKDMKRFLETMNVNSKTLIVTPELQKPVVESAKNLQDIKTLPASNLNVLDLLNYDRIIMTVAAIRKAESLWGQETPVLGDDNPATSNSRKRITPDSTTKTKETKAATSIKKNVTPDSKAKTKETKTATSIKKNVTPDSTAKTKETKTATSIKKNVTPASKAKTKETKTATSIKKNVTPASKAKERTNPDSKPSDKSARN